MSKQQRKPVERVIYDNYNLDEMYDDCRQYLIDEGIDDDPPDDAVWQEIWATDSFYWEEEEGKLREVFDNGDFIAVGTCGRWDGTYAGGFVFDNFNSLMGRFRDCDYIRIWDENGHFYVKGSHHDGTHFVEVKEITDKGNQYYDNWNWSGGNDKRTRREVHKRMFNDSHYTHLINFAHRFYGCPKLAMEIK